MAEALVMVIESRSIEGNRSLDCTDTAHTPAMDDRSTFFLAFLFIKLS